MSTHNICLNICCGYLLNMPHRGTSNEYPQHMFLCREKSVLKKKSDVWAGGRRPRLTF